MVRNQREFQDYLLLAESLMLIPVMALALRLLPFSKIKAMASIPLGKKKVGRSAEDHLLRRVRWAVRTSARRSPGRTKCFEQGLAAQLMLRRRGIDSSLFYGLAKNEDERLSAHVWVKVGKTAICGTRNAGDFAKFLRLPHGPAGA